MLKIVKISHNRVRQQYGMAAVEFAIVAMLLFILLFGIIEFGRLFYVFNSVQEVTRRAAREAVVRWAVNNTAAENEIKRLALFGGGHLPAGAEIGYANIYIEYLTAAGGEPEPMPTTPGDNISACLSGSAGCISLVRVSITGATYTPMVSLFSGINITAFPFSEKEPFRVDLRIPIPASTVIMPAESMGYSG
jgi:hypothetical protein